MLRGATGIQRAIFHIGQRRLKIDQPESKLWKLWRKENAKDELDIDLTTLRVDATVLMVNATVLGVVRTVLEVGTMELEKNATVLKENATALKENATALKEKATTLKIQELTFDVDAAAALEVDTTHLKIHQEATL